jgi:carboxyl-terminal processing protease
MKQFSRLIFCIVAPLFAISAFVKADDKATKISKNLSILNSVYRQLDMFYVDSIDYDKVVKRNIDNLLEKLDPYTVYYPEEDKDQLDFITKGEFVGIGAVVAKKDNSIYIADLFEGKAAQKAGIKVGDVILEVDGKKVDKMTTNDVSKLLKGTDATIVKIKIKRPFETKDIEKEFLRGKIHVEPVDYYTVIANKIGYLKLSEFTETAAEDVQKSVADMVTKDGINSLILDLRGNGGGLIDQAIKILGLFLPKGTPVVSTKGKDKISNRTYKTPANPAFPEMHLIVLVNRASASASELLAGAVQDLDRGVIVGERTYGKGLVQSSLPILYGGEIKLTTAKYYVPSGRCIQAIDYTHRNDDGSVGKIPDSLTSIYYTKNGRKVRDGGGVLPDSLTKDDETTNVAYYLYSQNMYFDFATKYAYSHSKIASPEEFSISEAEFNDFKNYLSEHSFSYTTQSEKSFKDFLEVAKMDGMDKIAQAEINALQKKFTPDIQTQIEDHKDQVKEYLGYEIVKRYFYEKGTIRYYLKYDKELKIATEILISPSKYQSILVKK